MLAPATASQKAEVAPTLLSPSHTDAKKGSETTIANAATPAAVPEFEECAEVHDMQVALMPQPLLLVGASQKASALRPRAQGETTSRVLPRPEGWQEEGILFPHEGIRFLLEELKWAVQVMDPKPAWKWENLSTWYQDYFYDVVHHHHDSEELIYLPWMQTRVAIPEKISADHPGLLWAMDELRDMLKSGASKPAGERAELLAQVRERVEAFVEDMREHLAEEEEAIPKLLREAGFTQEDEGVVVGQIIQSLGLDGNKKSLPVMLHGLKRWAGEEKVEAFVAGNLPLPIRLLYRQFWMADFQQRHLGLVASLTEDIEVNPFASRGLFCQGA
jgi:iron-sulfur cluster repair protein YtfE (RIC family)